MSRKYNVSLNGQFKGFVFISDHPNTNNYLLGTIMMLHFAVNFQFERNPDYLTDMYKKPKTDVDIAKDLVARMGYDASTCVIEEIQQHP